MAVLILSYVPVNLDRNTIQEHLLSFRRYSGEECYYLNVFYGVPQYIAEIPFEIVIFHYTFFAYLGNIDKKELSRLNGLSGYKIAMPQDEYTCTDRLNEFMLENGVDSIFTCFNEPEWQKIYPVSKSGLKHYSTVFPGYIDETEVQRWKKLAVPHARRTIDIGYRARKVPYWVGRFGLMKWQITAKFSSALAGSKCRYDLSNEEKDVFRGNAWYQFLSRCRVVLGCESGASLWDSDGEIKVRVNRYLAAHKQAGFDEVERNCFDGLDGRINLATLSPRHFEACITKTCQALIEGDYGGILKQGVHYIEIKKDWSNIQDVIRKIEDIDFCQGIAENAYNDIIGSGLYTYRAFVHRVIRHAKENSTCGTKSCIGQRKRLNAMLSMEKYPYIWKTGLFLWSHAKYLLFRILVVLNLYNAYLSIKSGR